MGTKKTEGTKKAAPKKATAKKKTCDDLKPEPKAPAAKPKKKQEKLTPITWKPFPPPLDR